MKPHLYRIIPFLIWILLNISSIETLCFSNYFPYQVQIKKVRKVSFLLSFGSLINKWTTIHFIIIIGFGNDNFIDYSFNVMYWTLDTVRKWIIKLQTYRILDTVYYFGFTNKPYTNHLLKWITFERIPKNRFRQ